MSHESLSGAHVSVLRALGLWLVLVLKLWRPQNELQILSPYGAGCLFNGVAGVSERDAELIQHGDHAHLSLWELWRRHQNCTSALFPQRPLPSQSPDFLCAASLYCGESSQGTLQCCEPVARPGRIVSVWNAFTHLIHFWFAAIAWCCLINIADWNIHIKIPANTDWTNLNEANLEFPSKTTGRRSICA